ncbi:hypothetical protein KAH55_04055 [bacterium]|nr:hypothetical protein [bacterium]
MCLVTFLLNLNSLSAGKNTVITILNFNDPHGISPVVDKLGERGGAARLKTVVDQVRRENCLAEFFDVYALPPSRNQVCQIELDGRQLIKILEHGVVALESKSG